MSGSTVGRVSIRDIASGRLPEILRTQLARKGLIGDAYACASAEDVEGAPIAEGFRHSSGPFELVSKLNPKEVRETLLQNEKVHAAQAERDCYTALLILAARKDNIEVVKLIMDKLGLNDIEVTS